MASLRDIKKDIDYLVSEVIADCYLSIYFRPESSEKVAGILENAVNVRNDLFKRVNSPAEKKNRSLVKKHYNQIRCDMFSSVDNLFKQLSTICKDEK